MRRWGNVRRRLSGVLDWSVVAKCMLFMAILLPVFLQYLLWAQYVLARPDRAQLIDVGFYRSQQPVFVLLILATLAAFLYGVWLQRKRVESYGYQAFVIFFFSGALVYFGWLVGSLTMAAGIVLIGTPLVGFILLDRRLVAIAWFTAVAVISVLVLAAAFGHIAYSPLILRPPVGDIELNRFWMATHLFWAAPHLFVNFALAWFTLARWRERETAFRTLSFTDELTGLHNRRSAQLSLEREVARTRRRGPPVAVLMVDLDHFKRVNDTWGHAAGDQVLRQAAATLQSSVREYDTVGRWGGEEFLMVLPDTTPDAALALAERCRARLAALDVRADNGERIPVSGSFGLACNDRFLDIDARRLIALTDEALYRAKRGGRNRVEVAEVVAETVTGAGSEPAPAVAGHQPPPQSPAIPRGVAAQGA